MEPRDGYVALAGARAEMGGDGKEVKGKKVPENLGVTSCPPPTWRYGPRRSML